MSYVKPGRFVGRRRHFGFTSNFTVKGVYTVKQYYTLDDIERIKLGKYSLAVFENMKNFEDAFDAIAVLPESPLNEASIAWGLKILELKYNDDDDKLDGNYIIEYTVDGVKDENEVTGNNVFMFYSKKNFGTGKRRKSQNRKRKTKRNKTI
jgi:hypothetical protein